MQNGYLTESEKRIRKSILIKKTIIFHPYSTFQSNNDKSNNLLIFGNTKSNFGVPEFPYISKEEATQNFMKNFKLIDDSNFMKYDKRNKSYINYLSTRNKNKKISFEKESNQLIKSINKNTKDTPIKIKLNKNIKDEKLDDIFQKLVKIREKIKKLNCKKKSKDNDSDINNEYDIDNINNNSDYSVVKNKFRTRINIFKKNKNININHNFNYATERKEKNINIRRKFFLDLSNDKVEKNKKIKINFKDYYSFSKDKEKEKNDLFNQRDKKLQSLSVLHNHIKYIQKIRDNEFLYLVDRYKKSLRDNLKKEDLHYESHIFPVKDIEYLVNDKNNLTIEKYKFEYIRQIDTYKMNTLQRLFKTSKKESVNNDNEKNDMFDDDKVISLKKRKY